MPIKGINVAFVKRIAVDEWLKFKEDQDAAIDDNLRVDTGTLHRGGAGRRYSVKVSGASGDLGLAHPDYERYQDMKRLRFGRTNLEKALGRYPNRKRNTGLHDNPIQSHKGKKIHNALIWGRMNSLAFRLFNDLKSEVITTVRTAKNKGLPKQFTINT